MKRQSFSILLASLFLLSISHLIISCKKERTSAHQQQEPFIDFASMDSSINPADNFFEHANGTWLKTTQIPADQTRWGSFVELYVSNQEKTKKLILDAADPSQKNKTKEEQVIGDFYASGMDTLAVEKKGFSPIASELEKIDHIQTIDQLIDYATQSEKEGYGFWFGYNVDADFKNSTMNLLSFYQSGLNLPDREYYLADKYKDIRESYKKYIATLFNAIGAKGADQVASQIIALETKIAMTHKKREELRVPEKNYNKVSISQLKSLTKNSLPWEKILDNMGLKTDSLNMAQPAYYEALGKLLKSTPIDVWKSKLKFDLIHSSSSYLSSTFKDARFDFYNKKLMGQQKQKDRWKIVIGVIEDNVDEMVGKLYAKAYFPESAKKRMNALVDNLFTAYEERIKNLDWMSEPTKQKALVKLHKISRKIGYPDKWKKNYDDMQIRPDNYFENIIQGRKHAYYEAVKKINQPVDKDEWGMSVSEVNAYYNPSNNEIVFPAGILQPPFFDEKADDAINYGGIGMVIGHEITHGFDDEGNKFDGDGNLINWWTVEDKKRFEEKSTKIVTQYSNYAIASGTKLNGKLCLGENIADIGGLSIAYQAFQLTQQAKGKEKIDGYTPNERFFFSLATIWKMKSRPESEEVQIAVDPHSPAKFRVNGPLSLFNPFYETFKVTEKNSMYIAPENRISIW